MGQNLAAWTTCKPNVLKLEEDVFLLVSFKALAIDISLALESTFQHPKYIEW